MLKLIVKTNTLQVEIISKGEAKCPFGSIGPEWSFFGSLGTRTRDLLPPPLRVEVGHSAPPSRSTAGPTLMTTLPLCWTRRRMLGKLRPSQEVEALLIGFLKFRQNTEGEGHDDNNNDNDFEDPSKLK